MLTVAVLSAFVVTQDGQRVPVPIGKISELLGRFSLEAGEPVRADRPAEDPWKNGGHLPRTLFLGRTTMRVIGVMKPAMREYLRTIYQSTGSRVVDDAEFCNAFGVSATPLDQALGATFSWYRATAPVPCPD